MILSAMERISKKVQWNKQNGMDCCVVDFLCNGTGNLVLGYGWE